MSIQVNIQKSLGDFQLHINFRSDCKRIGILGASGCGKSMTLKSIAGIETPDLGTIEVDGKVFFNHEKKINRKPQKRNVGYLFQNYALFPTMTVEKNIAAGLSGSKKEQQLRVAEMIEKFRLHGLEQRLPSQLSGGQQQRVAFARMMAYEPDLILLDEPFSALDLYLKDQLQRELTEMLEDFEGTVIMVSHNRDEIYRFSEELLVMEKGHISVSGKTEQLFENPLTKEAARLTGCKNISKAEKVGPHTVKAIDWDVLLETEKEIPDQLQWIGYRAHEFLPIWGEKASNTIPVKIASIAQLPFERNYYMDNRISWFVQRDKLSEIEEKGVPDYLQFDRRKILFLE